MTQLLHACEIALDRALSGKFDELFAPSAARGFGGYLGGVTWLDWSREFTAIAGWHQIVGHTPSRNVRAVFATADLDGRWDLNQQPVPAEICDRGKYLSMNWCVDTALRSVAIVEGSKFEVVWL